MTRPFTREEVVAGGSKPPSRGIFCPACETHIPVFAELSEGQADRVRDLARSGRKIEAFRELRDATGCSLGWAKIWIHHLDGPEARGFRGQGECPYCGGRLRTEEAKQCPHCLMSWHDPEHPRRLE